MLAYNQKILSGIHSEICNPKGKLMLYDWEGRFLNIGIRYRRHWYKSNSSWLSRVSTLATLHIGLKDILYP
jgi:hypothetical protein